MPSAVKQKLPFDLWRQSHGRLSPSSPVPYSGHEMQASPGQIEVEDPKQIGRYSMKKSQPQRALRRHQNVSGKGNSEPLTRRCSADTLNVATYSDSISGSYTNDTPSLSCSPDSDSSISYNSQQAVDAFAMDACSAPHPSKVPLPPIEWLRPSSKSPVVMGASLQVVLGCQVTA